MAPAFLELEELEPSEELDLPSLSPVESFPEVGTDIGVMETLRVPLLLRTVMSPDVKPPEAIDVGTATVGMVVSVSNAVVLSLPMGTEAVIVVTASVPSEEVGTGRVIVTTVSTDGPPVSTGAVPVFGVTTLVAGGVRVRAPGSVASAVTVTVPPWIVTVLPCTVTVVTAMTVVSSKA